MSLITERNALKLCNQFYIHQLKIFSNSKHDYNDKAAMRLHNGSWGLRLVFLGQRLLIVFIELLLELLPLLEVVHHLHLLPGVPLVQHPVRSDGLTIVTDTAGIILED